MEEKEIMLKEEIKKISEKIAWHNYQRFYEYIHHYERKGDRWNALSPSMKEDAIFCGQVNHYRNIIRKLN